MKSDAATRKKACAYASKMTEKTFKGSQVEDNTASYPRFRKDELTTGKLLGKGSFGTVHEIRSFDPQRKQGVVASEDEEAGGMESRQFIAKHCIRQGGDARYAVKALSPEVIADLGMFTQGIQDMALEMRFFSDIEHPNIIKIRALAETTDALDETTFIVMDRLYDTLGQRIKKWEKRQKRQGGAFKLMDRSGKKATELMEERIVAAFDLSAAFSYLHSRRIIYRDLKPENVGFDVRDDIKLFDFGLAKEIINQKPDKDHLYRLTEMTGSPRYMAPEVANGNSYSYSCDIYSFSILLWEILSLKTPFELYTSKTMKSRVWNGEKKRPVMSPKIFNKNMELLVKRGWNHNPTERNTMNQVVLGLRNEAVRVRGGKDSGLEHNRRRSTYVMPRAKHSVGA